jgi:hypothetical protein
MPEANTTNFVLPTPMQGFEFAARASERLSKLSRLSYPFYWFSHGLTAKFAHQNFEILKSIRILPTGKLHPKFLREPDA